MRQRLSRVYSAGAGGEARAGRSILGIQVTDIIFWVIASLIVFGLGVAWDFLFAETLDQNLNKYLLTFMVYAASAVAAVISLILARMSGRGEQIASRQRAQAVVRFGMALQIFGTVITPIGLFYATDPRRSVPVGFAFFAAVFAGLFIAGFAGNSLAPRRT